MFTLGHFRAFTTHWALYASLVGQNEVVLGYFPTNPEHQAGDYLNVSRKYLPLPRPARSQVRSTTLRPSVSCPTLLRKTGSMPSFFLEVYAMSSVMVFPQGSPVSGSVANLFACVKEHRFIYNLLHYFRQNAYLNLSLCHADGCMIDSCCGGARLPEMFFMHSSMTTSTLLGAG